MVQLWTLSLHEAVCCCVAEPPQLPADMYKHDHINVLEDEDQHVFHAMLSAG